MEQILFLLVRIVLIGCSIALTAFVCQRISTLNKATGAWDRVPSVEGQLYELERIVRYCIEETNQVFVNELKASGEWNEERMKEAFQRTFESVKLLVTKTTKEAIEKEQIDIDKLLTALIESYIAGQKKMFYPTKGVDPAV